MMAPVRSSQEGDLGPFEYLLLLAAVILGLALTDLAMSLHRLLAADQRVRWDWLAPLAAVVAFLKIVTQWWSWFGVSNVAKRLTFEMYVAELVGAVLLFLMAAAALPDEADDPVIDLRQHYARCSRRYWLLFAGQWTLITAVGLWAQVQIGHAHLSLLSPIFAIVPVAVSLAFIKSRWFHGLCLVALIVIYMAQFFGHGLGPAG